jgi:hypothetical protein
MNGSINLEEAANVASEFIYSQFRSLVPLLNQSILYLQALTIYLMKSPIFCRRSNIRKGGLRVCPSMAIYLTILMSNSRTPAGSGQRFSQVYSSFSPSFHLQSLISLPSCAIPKIHPSSGENCCVIRRNTSTLFREMSSCADVSGSRHKDACQA